MATAAPDKEKKKHYRHHHRRRGDLVSHSSASSTSSHSSSVSSSSMTGKSTLRPSSPLASSIPRKKLLLMEEEDDVESSRSSTSSTRTGTHSLRASPHRRPSSRTATRSSERGHQERHRRRKKEKKKKKETPTRKERRAKASPVFTAPSSPSVSRKGAAAKEGEEEEEMVCDSLQSDRSSSSSSSSSFSSSSSSSSRHSSSHTSMHRVASCQAIGREGDGGGVCRAYDAYRRPTPSSSSSPSVEGLFHSSLSPCTCARCGILSSSVHLSFLATTDFACVEDACLELLEVVRGAPRLFFIPPYASSSSSSSSSPLTGFTTTSLFPTGETLACSPHPATSSSEDEGEEGRQEKSKMDQDEKDVPVGMPHIPKGASAKDGRPSSPSFSSSSSLPAWPHMVFVLSSLPLSLFSLPISLSSPTSSKVEEKEQEIILSHDDAGGDVFPGRHNHNDPHRFHAAEKQHRRAVRQHGSKVHPVSSPPPSVPLSLVEKEVRQWKREEAMVVAVIHRLQTQYQVPQVSILAGGAAALRACHPTWFLPSRSRQRGPTIRR